MNPRILLNIALLPSFLRLLQNLVILLQRYQHTLTLYKSPSDNIRYIIVIRFTNRENAEL
uniref:Uncharacterized protein n=1 Tax=Kalanchoe fedtschenkoi TaxID=63787 RepID=A0A7N0UEZ1_KALFE